MRRIARLFPRALRDRPVLLAVLAGHALLSILVWVSGSPLGTVGIFLLGSVYATQSGMGAVFGSQIEMSANEIALFIAMPVILYQVWAFVAPGLYLKEKRFAVSLYDAQIVHGKVKDCGREPLAHAVGIRAWRARKADALAVQVGPINVIKPDRGGAHEVPHDFGNLNPDLKDPFPAVRTQEQLPAIDPGGQTGAIRRERDAVRLGQRLARSRTHPNRVH